MDIEKLTEIRNDLREIFRKFDHVHTPGHKIKPVDDYAIKAMSQDTLNLIQDINDFIVMKRK